MQKQVSWPFIRIAVLAMGALLLVSGARTYGAPTDVQTTSPLGFEAATRPFSPAQTPGLVQQFAETSYTIRGVDFAGAGAGWAVGWPHWDQPTRRYRSTIIHTADGGQNWTPQTVNVLAVLYAVDFVNAAAGWAVGGGGVILHTADGGQTWQQQRPATTDDFLAVAFGDARTGWAASIRPVHVDAQGDPDNWEATMWRTTDGGQTWRQQTLPAGASILHDLDFVSAQMGWAVGARYIGDDRYGRPEHRAAAWHTSDGGQTWQAQYTPDLEVTLTTVDFIDAQRGWAAGFPTRSSVEGGFVFHTADGGRNWERQTPGGFFDPLWDIAFIDQNRGYVVGANYIGAWGPPVQRTFDGGATWEAVRMARHENDGLYGVALAGARVIGLGDHDYQVTSERAWDSCEWTAPEPPCYDCDCLFTQEFLNTHYRFEDVFFTDAAHGWVVGSRSFVPEITGQVILHTPDGGLTWTQQYEHAPDLDSLFSYHRLDGVFFVDSQTGWAVGTSATFRGAAGWERHGAILHTTDGGITWQEQGQELYANWDLEFFAVHFLDAQNGWALAAKKFPSQNIHLAHTQNGGQTWAWVDTGIAGPLAIGFRLVQGDVTFRDAQRGWAAGGLGKIIYTTDGGLTWEQQQLTCGHPTCPWALYGLDFWDDQRGWLAGEGLYHTQDGGATWLPLGVSGYLQDVQFVDERIGWIVGERGVVLYTSNGGRRWHRLPVETAAALRGLAFVAPRGGWMVGDHGVILHYAAERLPVEAEQFLPLLRRR